MNIKDLVKKLDDEFFKTKILEDNTVWSITEKTKRYINDDFINKSTGLMLNSSSIVEKVFTTVFVTNEIVDKICESKNSLLFTHHNFDYFGSPTALVGKIPKEAIENFIEKARISLQRKTLTIEKHRENIERVAIVAGGGDEPDILQQAYDLGCDTFISGTIENKWGIPFIQENNKKFRELNKLLKLNLIGGTHYGTERFAMMKVVEYFKELGLSTTYIEDEELLKIP